MLMSAVLLVPLLPLLAALIVVVGSDSTLQVRAKIAAYPIGAAFLGAIVTLWLVATQGPLTIRFYDPSSLSMLAFPMGFYIDRLSAVMMVLISGVGTIIYTYSLGYMYQDPHERRYLVLIGLTTFVLLCMISSANLMMLFVFWQLLSYLLYLLAHNHVHAATLAGAFRTFTLLRLGDVAFLAGTVLAHQLYGTLEFPDLFAKATETTVTLSPIARVGDRRRDRRDVAALHRRHEQVGAVSAARLAAAIPLCPDTSACAAARRHHQRRWISYQPPGSAVWDEFNHPARRLRRGDA